jgi:hypothetical protein
MPGSNSETRGRISDGLGSNIVVQHSVWLHNEVHPMIQTLYPNSDAVFQDSNGGFTQMELFEEHEGELQHLPWPLQSPDLNISEPLWLVLETKRGTVSHLQHL